MPRDPISGRDLHPEHMDKWPDDVREALEDPGDPRSVTGSSGQGDSDG